MDLLLKRDLWIRLKRYRFENLAPVSLTSRIIAAFGDSDPYTLAFAQRVARKNGWTEEFAFLAVREYKKFVFLGIVSHYEVTPPKAIDRVWHEHQLFTRGYREFCRDVLKGDFDHAPELLPFSEQTAVYRAQYEKTLAFYKHEFGMVAPAEIWGTSEMLSQSSTRSYDKPPKKKGLDIAGSSNDDTPVFMLFQSSDDQALAPVPVTFEPGGGSFGGAGASASWNAPSATSFEPATSVSSGGTSSGSSCSSCSSCGGGGGGD